MIASRLATPVVLAALMSAAAPAVAAPRLLAIGELAGPADRSGLTGPLENGIRADILGGLGSGLAWAGGSAFLALPDRGPNASGYNPAVDDTVSYVNRFQTLSMALSPSAPGAALPMRLAPSLLGTTLLFSPTPLQYGSGAGLGTKADGKTPLGSGAPAQNTADRFHFAGRSDNFGPGTSLATDDARLDPEGIRVSGDGESVFVSDEYGPYVHQFDRASGRRMKSFKLPGAFGAAAPSASGKAENAGNKSGRRANGGMEGLAISPDGKTLTGVMQAPLLQDAAEAASGKLLRIVTINVASGATHEYGYGLTTGSGVSEIAAVNGHVFLTLERDGRGLGDGTAAKDKALYKVDLAGAKEISGLSGAAAAKAAAPKTLFVDVAALLTQHGVPAERIPAKLEGLAFGEDVTLAGETMHTLWIANDNDFRPDGAGPNVFYVLGVTDADLDGTTYVPQVFSAQ